MSAPPDILHDAVHPSRLQLDGLFVDSQTAAPGTRAHIATCSTCRAYLDELRRMAAEPPPELLRAHPARPQRKPQPAGWRQLLRPVFLGPSLAAAAALALFIIDLGEKQPRHSESGSGAALSTEKGGPGVSVYVQRGGAVLRWDGQARLRAGDRLRLEVAPADYRNVTVATEESGERLRALYKGPLPEHGAALLPASWQLDGEGDREILFVIFSRTELPDTELRRSTLTRPGLVVRELVLRKE
jgi:hypothetical protein